MENCKKELSRIQKELKAPKNQYNSFGRYKYRSCEDILEALKPILGECALTLSDDVVLVGDRVYIKSTARLSIENEKVEVSAFAREPVAKKGMDESQITGSASSYARKYALNGLFLIDDTKDAETQDNSKVDIEKVKKEVNAIDHIEKLRDYYKTHKGLGKEVSEFIKLRGDELKNEVPVI